MPPSPLSPLPSSRLVLGGFRPELLPGNGPWFPKDKPQPSAQARDLIGRMLSYDHAVSAGEGEGGTSVLRWWEWLGS